jgi:hypothetical protein
VQLHSVKLFKTQAPIHSMEMMDPITIAMWRDNVTLPRIVPGVWLFTNNAPTVLADGTYQILRNGLPDRWLGLDISLEALRRTPKSHRYNFNSAIVPHSHCRH